MKITPVVKPINFDGDFKIKDKAIHKGVIFNSSFLNGLKVPDESIIKTIEILEQKNRKKINFRLKDWGVSRQRY